MNFPDVKLMLPSEHGNISTAEGRIKHNFVAGARVPGLCEEHKMVGGTGLAQLPANKASENQSVLRGDYLINHT